MKNGLTGKTIVRVQLANVWSAVTRISTPTKEHYATFQVQGPAAKDAEGNISHTVFRVMNQPQTQELSEAYLRKLCFNDLDDDTEAYATLAVDEKGALYKAYFRNATDFKYSTELTLLLIPLPVFRVPDQYVPRIAELDEAREPYLLSLPSDVLSALISGELDLREITNPLLSLRFLTVIVEIDSRVFRTTSYWQRISER